MLVEWQLLSQAKHHCCRTHRVLCGAFWLCFKTFCLCALLWHCVPLMADPGMLWVGFLQQKWCSPSSRCKRGDLWCLCVHPISGDSSSNDKGAYISVWCKQLDGWVAVYVEKILEAFYLSVKLPGRLQTGGLEAQTGRSSLWAVRLFAGPHWGQHFHSENNQLVKAKGKELKAARALTSLLKQE